MNADLLLDNLAAIAAGPGGVGRLRELILQLAIHGKLGTNNPIELPLVIDAPKKRARKAKSQNGGSSKSQIIDIFPPDSISKNWRKTTLGNIGVWSTGGTPSRREASYFDGDIPWIKSGDLNDGIVTKTDETISQSGLDNSNAKLLPKGTISIALYGATIGKLGILGIDAATNQACANCLINKEIITSRYLFYFLRSQKRYFIQVGQGGAQPNITNWIIWEWPIIIPPLTEQHRIVQKVDRLMALCDDLDARQQAEREERRRFRAASLAALEEAEQVWAQVSGEFGRLVDTLEDVAELRKFIVDLGMRGMLVPHELGDLAHLPNPHLLARKIREKSNGGPNNTPKRSTGNNSINQIPGSWKLLALDQVLAEVKPGFASGSRDPNGIVQLRMNNVTTRGEFNWSKIVRVPVVGIKNLEGYFLIQGDILFNNTNSSELVGKSAVFNGFEEPIVYSNHFTRLRPRLESVTSRFIGLWLNYLWSSRVFEGLCNRWIGQSAVNRDMLVNLPFPLPPLAEQHRIIEKVDRLMALCDGLEAGIRARDAALEAFAAAACRAVLGGPAPAIPPAAVAVTRTGQQRLPV